MTKHLAPKHLLANFYTKAPSDFIWIIWLVQTCMKGFKIDTRLLHKLSRSWLHWWQFAWNGMENSCELITENSVSFWIRILHSDEYGGENYLNSCLNEDFVPVELIFVLKLSSILQIECSKTNTQKWSFIKCYTEEETATISISSSLVLQLNI